MGSPETEIILSSQVLGLWGLQLGDCLCVVLILFTGMWTFAHRTPTRYSPASVRALPSGSTGQVSILCLCRTALLSLPHQVNAYQTPALSKHLLIPQGMTSLSGGVKASLTPDMARGTDTCAVLQLVLWGSLHSSGTNWKKGMRQASVSPLHTRTAQQNKCLAVKRRHPP